MRALGLGLLILLGGAVAAVASSGSSGTDHTAVSCAFNGTGGDDLSRGFYVTDYPATNVDHVTLGYTASSPAMYTITLTARAGSYDGPVIGAHTVTVFVPSGTAEERATFNFESAPVARGSTIAFSQQSSPANGIYYDTGKGSFGGPDVCPHVVETKGANPPLDTYRRPSVGLIIRTLTPPNTAIVSDNINHHRHTARFSFKAIGKATSFGCALIRPGKTSASFSSCTSPKTYMHLAAGKFKFEVQAVNAAGPDPTPATRAFTIP